MLGKLIKHEWKSTYKVGCLMLVIMLIITFFGWLSFQSPMWQAISGETVTTSVSIWDIFSIFTLMIYVFMLLGVTYGIMIYLGVHFYKSMYTDEGYLAHTLPVTKHQLLGSKIIVSGLWTALIYLAVYLSVIILILALVGIAIPEGYSLAQLWREIEPEWGTIIEAFEAGMGMDLSRFGIYMLWVAVVSPFTGMTIMFGAITLGQLFTKHRVLMAIVCYLGVMVFIMLISSIFQSINSVNLFQDILVNEDFGKYMNSTLIFSFTLNLVMAVVLYFAAHYVNSRKLNME